MAPQQEDAGSRIRDNHSLPSGDCRGTAREIPMSEMQPSKMIDPKRVGISKTTIVAGSLCGRKAYFGENVRLPDGSRVHTPLNARMAFGVALDTATEYALFKERAGNSWEIEDSVHKGLRALLERGNTTFVDDAFSAELREAMTQFKSEIVAKKVLPINEYLMLQGLNGESLKSGDLIGTPDIIAWDAVNLVGRVIDVKAGARKKSALDLFGPELSFYAALFADAFPEASLPEIAYLTWVRTKEPSWQYLATQATYQHLAIAAEYAEATRALVKAKSAASVPFTRTYCSDCTYAKPIPEASFEGCAVGRQFAPQDEVKTVQA